ncbi:MAG: DUF1846 family protein, partial [Acidobacteria bacterium]|nr:DUF1846 family protein [Candidatus Sulfomarinibacter sp. MAG AM2]
EALMEEFDLKPEDRSVVLPSRGAADTAERKADKGHRGVFSGAAVELPTGDIVTGRNSPLMHASSALVLNAVKVLVGLPDHLDLISPSVIESIGTLRKDLLGHDSISLNLEETLIALSISSTTNPTAHEAMLQLPKLSGCELHLTHLPTPGDERGLRRLGVTLTCDPSFASDKLFAS